MASRLKELEVRLALLEEEVVRLRKKVEGPFTDETPAERAARALREAAASQPALTAASARVFEKMGDPPGMEKLRAMKEESDRICAAERLKRKASAKGRPSRRPPPVGAGTANGMNWFLLDASILLLRYAFQPGSQRLDPLFARPFGSGLLVP
jgi:hypothetical protein